MEVKCQYALPVYNLDNLNNIPDNELQFTINDQLFLDTLLMELRGKSISYSSHKKKQRDEKENTLISNICKPEQDLNSENIEKLESMKTDLYELRKEKIKGAVIRSRAINIVEGEKPTKYFCALESHNFMSKIVPKLQTAKGEIINDQKKIMNEIELFYKNLYSSKEKNHIDIDLNTDLNKYNTPS